MTEKERLENEIKVLDGASMVLMKYEHFNYGFVYYINALKEKLKALEKPEFKDGALGKVKYGNATSNIVTYEEFLNAHPSPANGYTFDPIPFEVIIKHLASMYAPEAVRWQFDGRASVLLKDKKGDPVCSGNGGIYRIPAPHLENWQGIGGDL